MPLSEQHRSRFPRHNKQVEDDKDDFLRELIAEHQTPLERYLTRKLDNARAFLYQVASNLAVDQLRRRTLHFRFLKSEKTQLPEGETADNNAATASPEQILAAREKLTAMYRAVDELPFKVKQAFLLHRRNGMSYTEIAESLDVSVSSVEKYLLQALRHCRKRLSGLYPDE